METLAAPSRDREGMEQADGERRKEGNTGSTEAFVMQKAQSMEQ